VETVVNRPFTVRTVGLEPHAERMVRPPVTAAIWCVLDVDSGPEAPVDDADMGYDGDFIARLRAREVEAVFDTGRSNPFSNWNLGPVEGDHVATLSARRGSGSASAGTLRRAQLRLRRRREHEGRGSAGFDGQSPSRAHGCPQSRYRTVQRGFVGL